MGVTAAVTNFVNPETQDPYYLVDPADTGKTGLSYTVTNGRVRVYSRETPLVPSTGSAFVLKDGLLTGTVASIGGASAYAVYGLAGRFGPSLLPQVFISDGKRNVLYAPQ
jgi:hypothetical protein